MYELNAKLKVLRQTDDDGVPLSITAFGNGAITSMKSNIKLNVPDHFENFSDRLSFVGQLLIARKFSERLSLILIPSFVHTNYVVANDQNSLWALGAGGRWKFSKRMGVVVDYFVPFRSKESKALFSSQGLFFYNPLGVALEIETGGHVFELSFTNSTAILENQFIPYTTTGWQKNQFRWGFNISRVFTIGKGKKNKK